MFDDVEKFELVEKVYTQCYRDERCMSWCVQMNVCLKLACSTVKFTITTERYDGKQTPRPKRVAEPCRRDDESHSEAT